MKMKKYLYVMIGVICFIVVIVTLNAKTSSEVTVSQKSQGAINIKAPDKYPEGTIHGDQNPKAIPDTVAYSLFLRSLLTPSGVAMAIDSKLFSKAKKDTGLADDDLVKLISIAEEYKLFSDKLDQQVKQIKDSNWPDPSPETLKQLDLLQTQKDLYISKSFQSLTGRLGANPKTVLSKYFDNDLKKKVKIVPDPKDLPSKWVK